jgi:hypothetical protein
MKDEGPGGAQVRASIQRSAKGALKERA